MLESVGPRFVPDIVTVVPPDVGREDVDAEEADNDVIEGAV